MKPDSTMGTRTMAYLSYGISTPVDLFGKLGRDGGKLTATPKPDDVFNFLVTAAALNEWVAKVYCDKEIMASISSSLSKRDWRLLPQGSCAWISDTTCLPNKHCDVRRHIFNALSICWETAGASKHYYWQGSVNALSAKPIVNGWYQYFTSSRQPDLYIDYAGEVYGLSQLRGIVLQFYVGFFASLDQ